VSFIAIIGLDFYNTARDPSHADYVGGAGPDTGVGIYWIDGEGLLIEDCAIRFHSTNIILQGRSGFVLSDVTVRRNVIVDAYNAEGAHSQGIFVMRTANTLIEENLFDHNGWVGDDRDLANASGGATKFNHNMYIQGSAPGQNTNVTVQKNISANASSHGVQLRPGGILYDNLFINNPISAWTGYDQVQGQYTEATYNVIDGAADIDSSNPRGTAFYLAIEANGVTAEHNLVINNQTSSTNNFGTSICCCSGDLTSGQGKCAPGTCGSNVVASNNIYYNWDRGCPQDRVGNNPSPVYENNIYWDTASNCVPSGSNLDGETYSFPDATRNAGKYNQVVLGGINSVAEFLAATREQSKDNWRPSLTVTAVNNWIRAGFVSSPSAPRPDAPTLLP
jgi:hypothetical protein